jgi:hypothetical protein
MLSASVLTLPLNLGRQPRYIFAITGIETWGNPRAGLSYEFKLKLQRSCRRRRAIKKLGHSSNELRRRERLGKHNTIGNAL